MEVQCWWEARGRYKSVCRTFAEFQRWSCYRQSPASRRERQAKQQSPTFLGKATETFNFHFQPLPEEMPSVLPLGLYCPQGCTVNIQLKDDKKYFPFIIYTSHTFPFSLFLRVPYRALRRSFAIHREPHSWLGIASGLPSAFSAGDLSFFSHLQRGLGLRSLALGLLRTSAESLVAAACSISTSSASLAPVSVVLCRGRSLVTPVSPSACWPIAGLSWVGAHVCLSGVIVVVGLFSVSSACSAESWTSPRFCSSVVLTVICATGREDEAISLPLPTAWFCIPVAVSCGFSFGGGFTLLHSTAPRALWATGRSATVFSCAVTSLSNFVDFLQQYLLWLISFPMIEMCTCNPGSSLLQGTLRLWHKQSLYLEAETEPSFTLVIELMEHSSHLWDNKKFIRTHTLALCTSTFAALAQFSEEYVDKKKLNMKISFNFLSQSGSLKTWIHCYLHLEQEQECDFVSSCGWAQLPPHFQFDQDNASSQMRMWFTFHFRVSGT